MGEDERRLGGEGGVAVVQEASRGPEIEEEKRRTEEDGSVWGENLGFKRFVFLLFTRFGPKRNVLA